MRWIHLTIITVFAAATMVFAAQNFAAVTVSFLGFSVRAPFAVLIALFYVLGMATGGSLWALLRRSIQGARRAGAS